MIYRPLSLLLLFCLSFVGIRAQQFVIEGKTNGYIPDGAVLYIGRSSGTGAVYPFASAVVRNGTFQLEGSAQQATDVVSLYGTEESVGHRMLRIWLNGDSNDTIRISADSEVPATWRVESKVKEQAEEDAYRKVIGKDKLVQASRINGRSLYDKSLPIDSIRILSNRMNQLELPGYCQVLEQLHAQRELTDVGLVWLFYASGYASYITDQAYLAMGKETYTRLTDKQKQTYLANIAKGQFFPVKAPGAGDYYIDAALTNLAGDSCKLADFLNKGKYILLDFWDQYCTPCKASVPGLKELSGTFSDRLTVIGINVGSRPGWEKGSADFTWTSLSDGLGMAGMAARYGVRSIPYFILFAPNGKIEKCWRGYNMSHSVMEKEIGEILTQFTSPGSASGIR